MNRLVREINAVGRRPEFDDFRAGDTVSVHVRIIEGDKSRVQVFTGTVISMSGMSKRGGKGPDVNAGFTVRKVLQGHGVERVFPYASPLIEKVERVRSGKARRAKLHYLRGRVGKGVRIREKFDFRQAKGQGEESPEASGAGPETPEPSEK